MGTPQLLLEPQSSSVLSDTGRLQQITDLELVDTPAEESFDRITRMAADILDVPVSLVSIVTDERQFFKSEVGLPEPWATRRETPLDHSFCKHVVEGNNPLVVEDATTHELVSDNLAVPNLGVVAYLGFPLSSYDGQPVGSFCVIDVERRDWTPHQIETVRNLAMLANNEINLRNENRKLRKAEIQLSQQAREIENTRGFLRDILDSVDANICIVGENGEIIDTNACWKHFACENGGAESHASIGTNYLQICEDTIGECANGAANVAKALREIVRGEREHFLAEYPCHSPEKERWFQVRLTPLKSTCRLGAVIAHIDITDRVLARKAFENKTAEAEMLALVARYTDNAVVITDDQCRIEWVNEGFTRITGYELDEVVGKELLGKFQHGPETSLKAIEEMRTALQQKRGFDIENVNYSKSGKPHWLSIEVRPITDSEGVVTNFIAVESDITQKKNAAKERQRLQNELLDTSHKAGMAELATGVLHNVGNVLNSINVSANLVCETLSTSAIASVRMASNLLEAHTDDLGDFLTEDKKGRLFPAYIDRLATRLEQEQGQISLEMESLVKNLQHVKEIIYVQQNYARVAAVQQEFDVSDLIDDAIKVSGSAAVIHDINIVRNYLATPEACTDKHKVLQVLINLISNARAAVVECNAANRPRIELTLTEFEGIAQVTVSDNGVGISPENMKSLFSHGFSTKKSGHGFGLHSSSNSARSIGGSLTAESDGAGKGATFTLTFPLRMDEGV